MIRDASGRLAEQSGEVPSELAPRRRVMQNQSQSTGITGVEGNPVRIADRRGVLASYAAIAGRHDELLDLGGATRPAWTTVRAHLDGLGREEFDNRWNHARRLIYENGVAYNAHSGQDSSRRPWLLDPIPLVISEEEWEAIEAGLIQRAQVLQLTLADLFGPRRLFREGVLASDVLFGHPGFSPVFQDPKIAGKCLLHFYGGDLARGPDGRWWVLDDRTEAPSGIGYALENRTVMSRMLPELFRSSNVHRLAAFFKAFQETLRGLAAVHRENPRIALLTHGPLHESFFEDAFLARYLGYNLVEGGDLSVREGQVWLKTLEGLSPLDVIFRRPNSERCDPLEFSWQSPTGVPGLLGATRTGGVAISNPLGSGLVESPLFMSFMPRLCQFFLKQDPLLPALATWWCGEPESLQFALANLDRLVVLPAFRRRGDDWRQQKRLSTTPPAQLRDLLRQRPGEYVVQDRFTPSTCPAWDQGVLKPAEVVLRAFGVARQESYGFMRGGLVRTSTVGEGPHVRDLGGISSGNGGKDAWVVSQRPVENVTLLPRPDEAIAIVRSGADLPSRVADNIFWFGRQLERADAAVRLLRRIVLRMTSEASAGRPPELPFLLRAMAWQGQIEPGYVLEGMSAPLPDIERSLPRIVYDGASTGSLRAIFGRLFRLASLARDRVSEDSWRILVRIDHHFQGPFVGQGDDASDLLHLCNALIVDLAAVEGLAIESMTRTHFYHFLHIGRRLERALQTVGLLRCCFGEGVPSSHELLESVLEVCDSIMTYRSRYLANLQFAAVLDLLLTDDTNPRSVVFQLRTLSDLMEQLPRDRTQPNLDPHQRTILGMVHEVQMLDLSEIAETHRLGCTDELEDLLSFLEESLPQLSNEIVHRYLVHAGPARMLSSLPIAP
jgi:uncharacterized circularly permuted ATP-grasp superfamily protein/uncharacterized alpha-E superfamily protein